MIAASVTQYFSDNWLSVLIAVILALGGGGGLAALLKNRNEGPKILVDAAQGAVVVQAGVIKDLQDQIYAQKQAILEQRVELNALIEAQKAEISELRTHLAELNSLRTKVRELEQKNEELQAENTLLSAQLRGLSRVVHENEEKRINGQ